MYPGKWAAENPEKPAVIMADTEAVLTYGQLEDRSLRLANHMRAAGLVKGDHIAVMAENRFEIVEALWAALRTGGIITVVNSHLTAAESAYIVDDCDAKIFLLSTRLDKAAEVADQCQQVENRIRIDVAPDGGNGGVFAGWDEYEAVLAAASARKPEVEPRGDDMLYSSGTTGRPKGILPGPTDLRIEDEAVPLIRMFTDLYGFDDDTVYLSPAPLYHAAPLRFVMTTHAQGGTAVVMSGFDAEHSLAMIEKHGATHSQWVPTMFIRMLKLPEEVRHSYDLSSLEVAIHAAAPCPPEVKRAMIDWWGPVIEEYYGATEGIGLTVINSEQALAKPGSVGREGPKGIVHICGPDGEELPAGEIGVIYFESERRIFEYYKDDAKTRNSRHPDHPDSWATIGDMGYLDEDRYLFIAERTTGLIIAGGVNIYPQEIENELVLRETIADVAVVGRPDEELGQVPVAYVQLAEGIGPEGEAEEIRSWLGKRLARFKIPREFHFVPEVPRTPTGKLVKRRLPDPAELAG
ncbi:MULTISPECIES: AMP-binding protein [Brevibacterium]|uniref:Fatty-acyl-CoA synthase n=2 Tax=Brevibacterium TaxID=1696 RepID=A0A1H1LY11_BRESA|nr:AMP-binding protein [Brevibacterium sandarakinum]SDR78679.1 fatty-acyl-CoA synthase [Brevibacterium sandarakinum]